MVARSGRAVPVVHKSYEIRANWGRLEVSATVQENKEEKETALRGGGWRIPRPSVIQSHNNTGAEGPSVLLEDPKTQCWPCSMQAGRFRKVFKYLHDNDCNDDYSVLGEFPYNTHLTLDYDWKVYLDRDIDHNLPHCLPLICPSLNPLFHFYSCSQPLSNGCSSLVFGLPESHHNLHTVQNSTVSIATNSPHHPHPTATALAPG